MIGQLCIMLHGRILLTMQATQVQHAKQQGLFDIRMKALKDNSQKGIIYLNPRSAVDIPQRWY
jgi:hypothetical protein